MDRDMTRGSIARTLVLFSIPLVLSGLLQQLYSWADALIVGNFVGEGSLAAIGATGTVTGVFLSVVLGFSTGVSIVVSQAYGAGEKDVISRVTGAFALLLTGASVLLAVLGIALAGPLLRLLRTPSDIFDLSRTYLCIVFAGLPALAIYNIYSAALRGVGDSRTPLMAIAISAVSNVLMDLLLVAVIPMGVAGAAIATALSQWAMAAFLIWYAPRKHPLLRYKIRKDLFDRAVLSRGFSLGVPTTFQSAIRSVGGLLLQNVMNGFGSTTVAAITTAYRIDSLILLPVVNAGAGVSTLVAQNKGAGDLSRAHKGLKAGALIALVSSLVTTAVVVLLGGTLLRLFGITEEAVRIGRDFLFFCAVFYPIFGVQQAFLGFLQGMGDVKFAAFASISSLAVRVLLSYLFADTFGNRIIAYAEMVSWVYCLLICIARYIVWRRQFQVQK